MSRGRAPSRPGVYLEEPGGGLSLVHAYSDDAPDYVLEDLPELLGFGRWEEGEPPRLTLAARDLRALATEAEARAFDLEDQIFGKALIGKMLKSDVEDRKSLVNRLTDSRLKTMFETLGFEPGGEGNANTTDRVWQERIVALYIDTQFVNAQGDQNTTVGIALEFRRKASSIETGFDVLKDPEMSNFMRTILGFPAEMAQVDIDKQAKMFEAKYDFSKLQDPAEVERLIRRFVIVSDALDGSAIANNAAVQLISGTLGSLGDGTFVPATIDITAISAIRGGY